jgi:(2Fe-2S) ferredoxin
MALPQRHLLICTGEHCRKKGGKKLCKAFKSALDDAGLKRGVRPVEVECMGQCGHGPMVLVYPDATWYAGVEADDVVQITDQHLAAGKPVTARLYRRAHGPFK